MIAMLDHRAAPSERDYVLAARKTQLLWAQCSLRERTKFFAKLRPILAERAEDLARAAAQSSHRPVAEKLVSEVLPLLEACKFLSRQTERILATKRFGAAGDGRIVAVREEIVLRKPFGVVLIVGPRNYPLFIPAVQTLHALAAGNAVLLKPAEGTSSALSLFLDSLNAASFPPGLVQLLSESSEAAREAARCGIDKAIFTGSSENGRDFLAELALRNIPSVMELSGEDMVFVRADADLELAVKAIAFGRRLNAGDTCMAPHAIVAHTSVAPQLERALGEKIISARDDEHALGIAARASYRLGASIFSRDENAARAFAHRLTTGFVTINDVIVPTADPRFPFVGTRASGFGVTRGAEGLLEMTYPQAIAVRRGKFTPHLDEARPGDDRIFTSFIQLAHGRGRWSALKSLIRAARMRL